MEDTQEQPVLPQLDRIRAVNHHLRNAIDRVSDGVLILESEPYLPPGPRVIFCNHAARKITGFKAEDVLGQPIGMIYDPTKLRDFLVRLPAVAQTGKTYRMETRTACADGTSKLLRWTICPIREGQSPAHNFLVTICPEQRDQFFLAPPPDDERQRTKARAAAASARKTPGGALEISSGQIQSSKMESLALVASGIAHDFNNILTTVIANLSLAKLETAANTELRGHVNDATAACESAKSLIQQLLAFARGDTLMKRETHIGTLLKESVSLATYGANVRCDVSLAPDLWSAEIDRTQITQVLSNLLINARQAMPGGGVVQVGAENIVVTPQDGLNISPGKYVVITVRDRGCGIPEGNLKRIFDPFFTTKKEGTGLGLATCYSLVEKHSGTILVRSKEHVGTEFRVFLPATGRPSEAHAEKLDGRLMTGEGAILVVDDQESVRAVAAAILSKLGYKAITSSSGQEAVDLYRERFRLNQPLAAVLMDMTLPGGLSGEDTFDEIRKIDPDVCTIATSGYFDDDSQERFIDHGFAGLLPKPYTAETLSQVLHNVLRGEEETKGPQVLDDGIIQARQSAAEYRARPRD